MKGSSSTARNRARRMRKTFTDAEMRLWQLLRGRNLKDFKFRRQHPLGPYIADFICLERRLVIEVDGGQHQEQAAYDGKRTKDLEAAGYRVLRFWDNDVLLKTNDVMEAIYHALHAAPHPAPAEGGAGSKRIMLGCDPGAGCSAEIVRVLMCAYTVASPETGAPAPRSGAPLPVHTGRGNPE
jgi:very-short-patch-repair endonuclease